MASWPAVDWMNLPEQFIVCRDLRHLPEGWMVHAIGDWFLGYHPTLPVATLVVDGQSFGWMLGYAISGDGLLLGSERITVPATVLTDEAMFERWVYQHGGRFVAIFAAGSTPRVYLDPIGSLSVVYCPSLEMAASTVTVVPREGDTDDQTELAQVVGIPRSSMYPLQYTPRKNVWRLIPNHVLYLTQWDSRRHWPKAPIPQVDDMTEAADELISRVRLHIKALMTKYPVLLRLTAGLDSRMLLACARPYLDQIKTFTVEHESNDEHSWLDCSTAKILAQQVGLRDHVCLKHQHPRQDDLDEWLMRTGWNCGEERGWRAATTYKQLPPSCADLIALVGEVARGVFWRPDDNEKTVIGIDRLAARFRAGQTPEGRGAIGTWLEQLPFHDPFITLDLFFMEQRLGSWAGIYPYAYGDRGRFQIFPMLHRRVIETMLALPPRKIRGTELLPRRIMEQEWPELLAHPFNKAQGTQRIGLWWVRSKRDMVDFSRRLVKGLRHPISTAQRIKASRQARKRPG
ncbi:MAG: asparagine synthase-related protein [Planctomycetota bacterium]|nr:asparagine synthase-related protein [Planctomycetota bacterium]MDA1178709.1 asparagine synthase-related protein [Planctomycetota bacterium]